MIPKRTPKNWVVVSAANAEFFVFLRDTVDSIRDKAAGKDAPFVVFDLGLTQEQRAELEARSVRLTTPGWDYEFSSAQPEWFKAMTARPNLPKWLPGFDLYFWIDADAWVQRWDSVDLFLAGAARYGFAAAAEADRAFPERLGGLPEKQQVDAMQFRYRLLADFYGDETAKKLCAYQGINCGVFGALATSPIWPVWDRLMRRALQSGKGNVFFAEQTAMNVALLSGEVPFARLSAEHNWVANRAWPKVGHDGALVHPDFPHEPLGIIHRTAETKRLNRSLNTIEGLPSAIGLGYPRRAIA